MPINTHKHSNYQPMVQFSESLKYKDQRFQIIKTHQRCTNKHINKKRTLVPLSTQNHKSLNEEPDFHPTMYSLISSHGGILAS